MSKQYHTQKASIDHLKVDAKNKTIEANGVITIIIVIGAFILAAAYIYGKFFHVKVIKNIRKRNVKRKERKAVRRTKKKA